MKNPKKPLKRMVAKASTIETKKLPKKDTLFKAAGKSMKADIAGGRIDRARSKFSEMNRLDNPEKLKGLHREKATYELYESGVLRKNIANQENPTPAPKPSASGKVVPKKKMTLKMSMKKKMK